MTATVSAPANVARARQLLHSAAEASKQLEENVRELVTMRAWDVLGYENFSEMWEKENGFRPPTQVQAIAVDVIRATATGREMAAAIGLSTDGIARTMAKQLSHGVPPAHVAKDAARAPLIVSRYGTEPYAPGSTRKTWRGRATPKRLGAGPDELVSEGFSLSRREADEVSEIARKADMPKAEIYRQAVAEYLARYRASRPEAAS